MLPKAEMFDSNWHLSFSLYFVVLRDGELLYKMRFPNLTVDHQIFSLLLYKGEAPVCNDWSQSDL